MRETPAGRSWLQEECLEQRFSNEEQAYYALTRRAFDILAPIYELMTLPVAGVRERVVDFAKPGAGSFVLDVATGTGQQAFAFARRGCRVVGIDLTEAMLTVARRHNRNGLVRFEAGDATKLPYAADTFDITCISFALHDMPPSIRERVVREMVRVTRNDGSIIVVDYDLPRNRVVRALLYRLESLYESEYYRQFITSNLRAILEKASIQIRGERELLLGAARVFSGQRKS